MAEEQDGRLAVDEPDEEEELDVTLHAEESHPGEAKAVESHAEREEAHRAVSEFVGADTVSEEAAGTAFGFYLVLGIVVALLVVAAMWVIAVTRQEPATAIRPGIVLPMLKNALWAALRFPA